MVTDRYQDQWRIYNQTTGKNLFRVYSSGNIEIPNGNLNLSGNNIQAAGKIKNNNGELIYDTSNGKLYANKPNVNGGGLWISDDGGFYDYNDGWIRFEGSTGIDMSSNRITDLASPSSGSDAATKNYVDSNGGDIAYGDGDNTPDNIELNWYKSSSSCGACSASASVSCPSGEAYVIGGGRTGAATSQPSWYDTYVTVSNRKMDKQGLDSLSALVSSTDCDTLDGSYSCYATAVVACEVE